MEMTEWVHGRMNAMDSENRTQKRIRLNLTVHVTMVQIDHSLGAESVGKLYDLSVGGCAFHHTEELPIGERVQVRIELNEQLAARFRKPVLTARGVIIRCVREEPHHDFLVSIRFQPMPPS